MKPLKLLTTQVRPRALIKPELYYPRAHPAADTEHWTGPDYAQYADYLLSLPTAREPLILISPTSEESRVYERLLKSRPKFQRSTLVLSRPSLYPQRVIEISLPSHLTPPTDPEGVA